jgi:transcriptional regulator with XRE-family HTH domain
MAFYNLPNIEIKEISMNVGKRLNEVRKKAGLSQRELAKRVGVTNSTISMIEKNNVSPSVSSLQKILSGMSMTLLEFFEAEDNDVYIPQIVYTTDDFTDVSSSQVKRKSLGQYFPNRQLEFTIEVFPPGAEKSIDMGLETGDKAGFVIEGQLVLTIGERTNVVGKEEGFYFDSSDVHFFRNENETACRMVVVRALPAS